jgi:Mitochondrial biogenesis AIM24
MSLWKTIRRLFYKVPLNINIPGLKTDMISSNAITIDLMPYQVLYANPNSIKYLNPQITMESTTDKLLELSYPSTEGYGSIVVSYNSKLFIISATKAFFCTPFNFICGTSQLKILIKDGVYEVIGNGTLILAADEVLELEEDEKILIHYDSLIGFDDKVNKEIVKVSEIPFWSVTGPGLCAIKWNKIFISPIASTPSTDSAKTFKPDSANKEDKGILTRILDSNDVII